MKNIYVVYVLLVTNNTRSLNKRIALVSGVPVSGAVLPTGLGAMDKMQLPPLTPIKKIPARHKQPFSSTFCRGLIKRCHGCQTEFSEKSKTEPHDMILKTSTSKNIQEKVFAIEQTHYAATYYHLSMNCVRMKFPQTQVQDILLCGEVARSLTPGHVKVLETFGVKVPAIYIGSMMCM